MDFALINWTAVIAGWIAAFVLGFLIYAPFAFGPKWAAGSHLTGKVPDKMPMGAMAAQAVATFLLALIIGLTETAQAIDAAILAILTVAAFAFALASFGLKSTYARLVDAGAIIAFGIVMIAAQALI
jgi:hypothetical protein